jgi:hypothetical protein
MRPRSWGSPCSRCVPSACLLQLPLPQPALSLAAPEHAPLHLAIGLHLAGFDNPLFLSHVCSMEMKNRNTLVSLSNKRQDH